MTDQPARTEQARPGRRPGIVLALVLGALGLGLMLVAWTLIVGVVLVLVGVATLGVVWLRGR